ncbi:MAG: hypothetical protein QG661_2951 [Actinomycetota bacterium]|jgi:hypothetical protein|nr:hypothetical protein [Actinomycetota bacterium]
MDPFAPMIALPAVLPCDPEVAAQVVGAAIREQTGAKGRIVVDSVPTEDGGWELTARWTRFHEPWAVTAMVPPARPGACPCPPFSQ